MEIDIRDSGIKVDKIRFADDGAIKVLSGDMFEFVSDCHAFPFGLSEVDSIIKALQKIREVV